MSTRLAPDPRILTRDEVIERYARPREFSLVLTNGCFDILHRGHAEYLLAASKLGDALVVAVNTDDSVRRLKGPGRPIVAGADRAFMIASLACVDAVTLFAEDSPCDLIAALLPDVLVKGADYRPDEVVGRAEVEAAGGRLTLLPYREGHSTSELLKRVRAR